MLAREPKVVWKMEPNDVWNGAERCLENGTERCLEDRKRFLEKESVDLCGRRIMKFRKVKYKHVGKHKNAL